MSTLTYLGIASMAFCAWFTWYQAFGRIQGADYRLSPRAAVIEAWINIIIGFSLNFVLNMIMIPLMTEGAQLKASNNWWAGWFFTVVSMLRTYGIRRWCGSELQSFAITAERWLVNAVARLRTSANKLIVVATTFKR